MWHSSIVSGREAAKRILTASGKTYNLLAYDSAAMLQSGFSKTLTARLARGFPEAWREHLVQELGIQAEEEEEKEGAKVQSGQPKAQSKAEAGQSKASPSRTALKTPARSTALKTPAKRPKSTSKARSPASTKQTPKQQQISEAETPRVLCSTRSGRKVVTPLPFWDSQAVAAFKPSPSLQVTKRRWGAL